MKKSPPIQIGFLLDVKGTSPPGVPITLKTSGLKSHTAIIAQSGAGKSFILGRLLEEMASKTRARIVILDPNSDFILFSEIDREAWKKEDLKKWFGPEDTYDSFKARWDTVGSLVLTNRESGSLELKHSDATVSSISIRWGSLTHDERATYLEFSNISDPIEILTLYAVSSRIDQWLRSHSEESSTIELFKECAGQLWLKTLKAIP